MAFTLESAAFANGGQIPGTYSRDSDNMSPPLAWRGAPPGTKSFVLILEDPDAPKGVFRHWCVYDISPARTELPEGTTGGAKTESLGHGVNDFGSDRYEGPQPPKGHGVHHYRFRLAALDVDSLHLPPRARIDDVWSAARPHVIAEAELVGTFENR